MKTVLKTLFWVAWIPFSIWFRALSIMMLWNWFVHPIGPAVLSMAGAYGLSCFAALFYAHDFRKDETDPITNVLLGNSIYAMALLTGYITHRWWMA